ncbi:MAG: ABC transporter permease subunit [Anaerolineales bacterium]|nr:ABC transporter permease [Anaerolineales bacterium]
MSSNDVFTLVQESGWRGGLRNMLRLEFGKWWGSRLWWVQSLIWVLVINGMLAALLWSEGTPDLEEAVFLYCIFSGLFPNIAVIIIMQGVIVGEKEMGTAAWLLSKPVSRQAYVLSKWIANSVGVLVTMVVLPGIFAYLQFYLRFDTVINPLYFLMGWGIFLVYLIYYLSLTLMLGTFFKNRGPVIAIPLALAFGSQLLFGILPFLTYILPWVLTIPQGDFEASISAAYILGQDPVSMVPFFITFGSIFVFLFLGLWRFKSEEF